MKGLIVFVFIFITLNVQANLFVKKKINFNSCQELYETGNYQGEGIYKIKKDNVIQDLKCIETITLKSEHNYYNGYPDNLLNWKNITPSDNANNCNLEQNINYVFMSATNPCVYEAKTGINYTKNDIIEIEFNIQRSGIGLSNDFDVFGILSFYYRRKQPSLILIGDEAYNIDGFSNSKVKIIRENNNYMYYLNDELVSENTHDFSNVIDNSFISEMAFTNLKISNINIKVYEYLYIEEY